MSFASPPTLSVGAATDLAAALRDPQVGIEPAASMRAVRAICVQLVGQSETSPLLIGALDMIAYTSELTQVLAIAAGVAGRPENVSDNSIGRAIGAARMMLTDAATMGQRRISLDEGAPRSVVVSIIEYIGAGYGSAPPHEQEALAHRAATLILAALGKWPNVETVKKALAVATQSGVPRKQKRSSNREVIKKGAGSKGVAVLELLRELGIAPANVAAMKRTLARRRSKKRG